MRERKTHSESEGRWQIATSLAIWLRTQFIYNFIFYKIYLLNVLFFSYLVILYKCIAIIIIKC